MRDFAFLLLSLAVNGLLLAQPPFRDATSESGIVATDRARGVSVCDYNGDGHPDLFICNRTGTNLLYRNDGNARFAEVGAVTPLATAGPTNTALWADLDNDGTQEVLLGNVNVPSRLYTYRGGSFQDITAAAGIDLTAMVQTGVVFDYDGDGLLDLYLAVLGGPNRLYHNLGNLQFEERGADAGANQSGLAMATLAFDYDLDGDQDLYLVHDGPQANVLLRNDGGTFADVSTASSAGVVGDGMGVDAADYDGDGDFDLYITNLYENFLLQNQGNGTFREIAFDALVNDLGMGWGTAFIDYDNDGYSDLYVTNETNFAVGGKRYPNILYRNDKGQRFTPGATPTDAICSDLSGYGTAVADFNGNGYQDLFVANSSQRSQLFLNTAAGESSWLSLGLTSTSGNRDAIGALAKVYADDGRIEIAEVRCGGSYASQHDRRLHFGLGAATRVDSLVIYWPGGRRESYTIPALNKAYNIGEEGETTTAIGSNRATTELLLPYPNPTTGRLSLRDELTEVRVYDQYGRVVLQVDGPVTKLDLPITLPGGVYRIIGAEQGIIYMGSFILQH